MKNNFKYFLALVLFIPCAFIFSACSWNKNIKVQVENGNVQWAYEDSDEWTNVISIKELKAELGDSFQGEKGDKGDQGEAGAQGDKGDKGEAGAQGEKGDKGDAGINGKEVEFQKNETHVQWKYKGETDWRDLIALSDLKPAGDVADESELTVLIDDENFEWQEPDSEHKTIELKNYKGDKSKISIPKFVNKDPEIYTVVGICDGAFANNTSIVSIEMPDSVVSVGKSAFVECTSLSSVKFSNSVQSIGDDAFKGCALECVELPKSLSVVGEGVFRNNTKLRCVTNLSKSALISDDMFNGCVRLKEYIVSNTINTISQSAFNSCVSLTEFTISEGATIISSGAFAGCLGLEKVFIDNETVSNGLITADSFGGIIANAEKVFVKQGCAHANSTYLTENFIESELVLTGYKLFIRK